MLSLAQNYLTRSFWGDEAWTSLISQLPYLQMLKTTAADFHPPAYYTVVELWYKIFPTTEVSTRLISVIFYLLTVFMVYKLVSSIYTSKESESFDKSQDKPTFEVIRGGRFWGILTASVVLVNPIFFRYAFEARNYTMFAFFATCSIYFLLKLYEKFDFKRAAFFAVLTALGLYTHYYMFFVLVAQGLYLAFSGRKLFLKMVGVYAVVGVLYLPWIPFLLSQLRSVGGNYWIQPIDWQNTHFDALRRILGGEQDNLYQRYLYRFSILLAVVGLAQHILKRTFEKTYLLIWLWATVPFVLATLPGLQLGEFKFPFRPIFFWRYLIPAAIPLSIVIVHAAQKLPKPFFAASMAVIIIGSIYIDYNTFFGYPKNFKQAYSEKIIPTIKPTDKIVTILPSFGEVLYYRERNNLNNELIVLPENLVQHSGKSLLDAYVDPPQISIRNLGTPEDIRALESGVVYWELRPGPKVEKVN